jgi:DNA-binding response OmpR family regulator
MPWRVRTQIGIVILNSVFVDLWTVTVSSFSHPTALLIDDESSVRAIIRRTLEPAVCAVVEAEDGEKGLQILERGVPPIDLVLVDMMLPGLNGLNVIENITRSHPELPLLCMTGFGSTASDMLETTVREYRVPVLLKPFDPPEVAEAVRALLERAGRRAENLAR